MPTKNKRHSFYRKGFGYDFSVFSATSDTVDTVDTVDTGDTGDTFNCEVSG